MTTVIFSKPRTLTVSALDSRSLKVPYERLEKMSNKIITSMEYPLVIRDLPAVAVVESRTSTSIQALSDRQTGFLAFHGHGLVT